MFWGVYIAYLMRVFSCGLRALAARGCSGSGVSLFVRLGR